MIEYRVYKNDGAVVGAELALSAELHMPAHMNWELRGRLISVRNGSKAYVAIARKHNLPVAVVLVRLTRDGQSPYDIAAYCKDAFRRQGISTQLINALKAEAAPLPEARTGINGSHTFWIKNGIDCIPTYWD